MPVKVLDFVDRIVLLSCDMQPATGFYFDAFYFYGRRNRAVPCV